MESGSLERERERGTRRVPFHFSLKVSLKNSSFVLSRLTGRGVCLVRGQVGDSLGAGGPGNGIKWQQLAVPGGDAELAESAGVWLPCWSIPLAFSFFQAGGAGGSSFLH